MLADNANLGGVYKAWLSDGAESPSTRFTHNPGPYVLPTGVTVANSWNDLVGGSLLHAINVTEAGGTPPTGSAGCGTSSVWTDTKEDGTLASGDGTCAGWTDVTGSSSVWGQWGATSSWSQACSGGNAAEGGCGSTNPLYCFEQ
jgi:hypothetical protein